MVKLKTVTSILNNLRNYQRKLAILAGLGKEEGILPDSFMPILRQIVSFRNRVVHLYWDLNDATVYDIVQQNLGDFETYVSHILSFFDNQPEMKP